MTAALFFVDEPLASVRPGQVVAVTGPEGHHAVAVRRLSAGEPVLLADGTGTVASGTVSAAERDRLEVRVDTLDDEPAPEPAFLLVQALAKDGRDLMAVEAATELGVDVVLPWQAERSVVQWRGDKVDKGRHKWANAVRAAAKQARRARIPYVLPLAVRGELTARLDDAGAGSVLVLHEQAERSINDVELPARGTVALVVGPEGGLSEPEISALTDAGGVPVRMGTTVLRSSSAGPAAMAVLAARTRW